MDDNELAKRGLVDLFAISKINPPAGLPVFPPASGKGVLGTIQQYYTIWCGHDDCVEWEDIKTNTKTQAAKIARRNGWKLTKRDGWICPRHTSE